MTARRLTLTREALVELTHGELSGVVGGTHLTCGLTDQMTYCLEQCDIQTVPARYCFDTRILC